jgi:uncharacterized protein YceK
MKTNLFLWAIFLLGLSGCTTVSKKEIQRDRYSGVYVAETVFESAKQWDTLVVRNATAANPDSFLIFYADGYIKKLPNGEWTERKFIHDTFPAIAQAGFTGLLVGDSFRMPADTVNGQAAHTAPSRPMHIDTVNKSARFGGFVYKKID